MSDPKRPYCDGSVVTTSNCDDGVKVKGLKNVTTMLNEAGAAVAPFARKRYTDACNVTSLDCIPAGGGGGHSDHCLTVIDDATVKAELPPDTDDPIAHPDYDPANPILVKLGNTFAPTDPVTKVDAQACPKYGVKSTQAVKAWHGAFPLTCDANGVNCQYPWKFWDSGTHAYIETAGTAGVPVWDSAATYALNDLVVYTDNRVYISTIASNTGVTPPFHAQWSQNTYVAGITYAAGAIVFQDGLAYKSLADGNLGHNPASSPTWWQTGVPNRADVKYLTRNFTLTRATFRIYEPYIDPAYLYSMVYAANVTRSVARNSGKITSTNWLTSTLTKPDASTIDYICRTSPPTFDSFNFVWTDMASQVRNLSNPAGLDVYLTALLTLNNTLSFSTENMTAGDTLTVGSKTYTFVASSPGTDDVLIGATATDTADNLFVKLASHPQVDANPATYRIERKAGNTDTIALSSTKTTYDHCFKFGGSQMPTEITFTGFSLHSTLLLAGLNYNPAVDITITRSATVYSWDVVFADGSYNASGVTLLGGMDYAGSITLSDPYYIGDSNPVATDPNVLRDASEIAAVWQLRDKRNAGDLTLQSWQTAGYLAHPWRTDEHAFVAVQVTRDEKNPTTPEIDYDACPVDDYTVWPLAGTAKRAWFDNDCLKWKYNPPANPTEAAANALISTGNYTGNIIGKPLPQGYGALPNTGGNTGTYDFLFERWQRKWCDGPPEQWIDDDVEHGLWTPSYLPQNCQRWTRHLHSPYYGFSDLLYPALIWPASFVKADKNGIFMQKMVETIIPKPSYDFSRPHTADRFLLDQPADPTSLTKIYYVASVSGSDVTLNLRDGTAATDVTADFTAGDVVGVCTIAGVAGFYTVASVAGGVVTVGALKWLVPTGYTNDSGDAATAFGKVRFPAAPGFSGLLPVTTADSSGDTLLTYTAQPCIQTNDLVDLWNGATWDDNSGAGYAVTRLTDTTATIAGAHLDTKAIVPHTYAVTDPATSLPLSGQKWYFADNDSKGDFVNRQWTVNLDSGEQEPETISAVQYCLPKKPCGQRVTGFSPQYTDPDTHLPVTGYNEGNVDFTNAAIVPFPLLVHNGDVWQGESETWMVDPLWQTPHKPGNTGYDYNLVAWTSDDGSCREDYAYLLPGSETVRWRAFYRLPDFYESRLTPPSNYGMAHTETAPLPPTPINLAADQSPPAHAHMPQYTEDGVKIEGYFDDIMPTIAKPWGIYYRQLGCVCGTTPGRYATQYHANKIICT